MLLLQVNLDAESTPWRWIVLALGVLGEGLALVFVLRVLARGGSPASTLLWVLVILAAPWLGITFYYLFPHRLQLRRLRRIKRKQVRWRGELRGGRPAGGAGGAGESGQDGGGGDSFLRRLLRELVRDGVSDGNAVRWLPRGRDFVQAATEAIRRAQDHVHFEVYIFRPDQSGLAVLAELTAAARRGVAVRLLYDSFGSFSLKAAHLAELRAAGGVAEAFLPLLWKRRPFTVNLRNHRKLLVVDGATAFVGGRNIGDEYATDRFGLRRVWHDAMVMVEGPAVADLQQVFAEDWFHATDEELVEPRWFPPARRAGGDCVGVVGSGPDREVQELWFAVYQAINAARECIDLSSPYLVPPPVMLFALVVAAARGVRVRIFTNGGESEAAILYQAQRSYYREMLQAGIEIHETTSDYNHAKVLVVDRRSVVIGSANLDMRSASWNFELALVLPDSPDLAREVLATLDERGAGSIPVALDDLSTGLPRRIWDGICRLLSPVL